MYTIVFLYVKHIIRVSNENSTPGSRPNPLVCVLVDKKGGIEYLLYKNK